MSETIKVLMVRDKETKRKIRFREPDQGTAAEEIGFIYISKQFAGNLQKIEVSVEAA